MSANSCGTAGSDADEILVGICRDPAVIERILRNDAFDVPIPYFPPGLLRTAVRTVFATSANVCFVVAEVRGEYAGFSFAHTLGPGLWRRFARAQVLRHPLSITAVTLRVKVVTPCRRRLMALLRSRRQSPPRAPAMARETTIPKVQYPFAWSPESPATGQVDQLYVKEKFRGRGVAVQMLRFVAETMTRGGANLIEAHVDTSNHASLHAFLKAGWKAVQTQGGDFYVYYATAPQSASPDAQSGND